MQGSQSSQELPKKLSDLTLAVYRVTGLFPEGEVSCNRIRGRAMEILEDVTFYDTIRSKNVSGKKDLLHGIEGKISALLMLFKVVRAQRFVKELNFDILDWEYRQVLDGIQNEISSGTREPGKKIDEEIEGGVFKIEAGIRPSESLADALGALNNRQQHLIGFFKNNGSARLKEITKIFPDVSEKTIRNDLKVLCQKQFLKLNGRAPQSFYSLH